MLQSQEYSYSLHQGLLTGSVGEGRYVHWFARLLGYVCTAFLVACVNASLVGILCGALLRFPAHRSLAGSSNGGACPPSQMLLCVECWALRQTYPRGPPLIPVAGTSWAVMGNVCPSLPYVTRWVREPTL